MTLVMRYPYHFYMYVCYFASGRDLGFLGSCTITRSNVKPAQIDEARSNNKSPCGKMVRRQDMRLDIYNIFLHSICCSTYSILVNLRYDKSRPSFLEVYLGHAWAIYVAAIVKLNDLIKEIMSCLCGDDRSWSFNG